MWDMLLNIIQVLLSGATGKHSENRLGGRFV